MHPSGKEWRRGIRKGKRTWLSDDYRLGALIFSVPDETNSVIATFPDETPGAQRSLSLA